MKVLSLNVNDIGGPNNHLMECKIDGRIDWKAWAATDKNATARNIFDFICGRTPDIVVLQEFEVNNSPVPDDFIRRCVLPTMRTFNRSLI